jgi:hypothetical protein
VPRDQLTSAAGGRRRTVVVPPTVSAPIVDYAVEAYGLVVVSSVRVGPLSSLAWAQRVTP